MILALSSITVALPLHGAPIGAPISNSMAERDSAAVYGIYGNYAQYGNDADVTGAEAGNPQAAGTFSKYQGYSAGAYPSKRSTLPDGADTANTGDDTAAAQVYGLYNGYQNYGNAADVSGNEAGNPSAAGTFSKYQGYSAGDYPSRRNAKPAVEIGQ